MKTFLALLLVIGALASYLVLAFRFGVFQHYPVVHWLMALAGVVWLGMLLRTRFTWLRLAALVFASGLTGLYFYWTIAFSEYEQRGHRAGPGEVLAALPSLELPGTSGEVGRLFSGNERAVLLVFYRGYW